MDSYWTDGVSFAPENEISRSNRRNDYTDYDTMEELQRSTDISRETVALIPESFNNTSPPQENPYTPSERNIIADGYDPYRPIHKSETRSERTGALAGYCVEVQKAKKDWPDEMEWEVAGNVGPNYLLVPNSEVRDIAHEIADRSPWNFREAVTSFNGKKYMLCLEAEMESPVEVSVGDELSFGLMFHNTYDGTGAFKAQIYVTRLICTNGMVSKSFFANHRFRHTQASEGWQEDVRAALSMVSAAPEKVREFARRMGELKRHKVDQAFLSRLRAKGGPAHKLPGNDWSAVVDRWASKEENNQFGFLNAATNVLWHKKKLTQAHIDHNDRIVTGLLGGTNE